MHLAQGYNMATRVRIEPRPLAPESDALPLGHRISLQPVLSLVKCLNYLAAHKADFLANRLKIEKKNCLGVARK